MHLFFQGTYWYHLPIKFCDCELIYTLQSEHVRDTLKICIPYSAYIFRGSKFSRIAVLEEFVEKISRMRVAQGSNCRGSNF